MKKTNTTNRNTIKTFDNIKKDAQNLTFENARKIVTTLLETDFKALTEREKILIIVYREIKKAIDNKTHIAIIQYDFTLAKTDAHSDNNRFKLIRFVSRENYRAYLTNMYINVKSNSVDVKLTVTANKTYQSILKDNNYDIVKHCKTVDLYALTTEIKTLFAITQTAQTSVNSAQAQAVQIQRTTAKTRKNTLKTCETAYKENHVYTLRKYT